MLSVAW